MRSTWLQLAFIPIFLLTFMGGALAQQTERDKQKVQDEIEQEVGHSQNQMMATSKISQLNNFLTLEPEQSWQAFTNPNPELNLNVYGIGDIAGDVNNDGKTDLLFHGITGDERTDDLSDQTGKSVLYFADNYLSGDDYNQLLYEDLEPVGDLNGDGNDDALLVQGDAVVVFEGTDSGYQNTDESYEIGITGSMRSFGDLTGDGTDDVVLYESNSETLAVLYGNDASESFDDLIVNYYSMPANDYDQIDNLILADHNNNATEEIILTRTNGAQTEVRVITHSGNYDLFGRDGVVLENRYYELQAGDLNGDGYEEIVLDSQIYEFNPDGINRINFQDYIGVNQSFDIVGDVDNDGVDDAVFSDGDAYYINYGTTNIAAWAGDLSQDFTINPGMEYVGLSSQSEKILDLNGDGIKDIHFVFEDSEGVGRIIAYGSEDRNHTTERASFDVHEYVGSVALYTDNIGDINDDGVDDFVEFHTSFGKEKLAIYYGGNSISTTPDVELHSNDAGREFEAVAHGDFNDDGETDLAISVGSAYEGNAEDDGVMGIHIFYGADISSGAIEETTSDQYISFSDVTGYTGSGTPFTEGGFTNLENAGDLNNDGIEDLIYSAPAFINEDTGPEGGVFISFGGSSVSSQPDVTVPGVFGDRLEAAGDVSGDGISDFVATNSMNNQVYVFYGNEDENFDEPNTNLSKTFEQAAYYGISLAAGDLNGDGINDIAVKPYLSYQSAINIDVYYGGGELSSMPDKMIPLHAGALGLNPDNQLTSSLGTIEILPNVFGAGQGGLFFGSSTGTNALIYQANESASGDPFYVLEAANQTASLGSGNNYIYGDSFNAYGDFNDDGRVELVLTQPYDNNDHAQSSRTYMYSVPDALELVEVSDRADDQGSWVILSYAGSLVNAKDQGIKMYNELEVQKQDDGDWISTGTTIKYDQQSANRVEVSVPVTMPSDASEEEQSDYEQTFRITAFAGNSDVIVRSNEATGHALDNIAPGKVEGVEASQSEGEIAMTWSTVSDNDVSGYAVYESSVTNFSEEEPVAFTNSTSVEFEDEGYEELVVVAQDIHNNYGEPSETFMVTSSELKSETPDEFALNQNYPNPFNPSTQISYDLPVNSHTRVTVFNNIGQRVAVLVDEVKSAGTHQVNFDASGLTSGMYFYRIKAGEFSQTKKMMLIK